MTLQLKNGLFRPIDNRDPGDWINICLSMYEFQIFGTRLSEPAPASCDRKRRLQRKNGAFPES